MTALAYLRLAGPPLLAVLAALAFDRALERRHLVPPGFRAAPWRRAAGFGVVAGILWVAVFLPLGTIGLGPEVDLSHLTTPRLFLLHGLLILSLAAWLLLGFAGRGRLSELARAAARQLGWTAPRPAIELGLGAVVGVGAWIAVLAVLITLGLVLVAAGGEDLLPKTAPEIIPWIAALPVAARFLVALSAGVVEETFFRGFLQPRIGIAASTACFALAHLSYGQPFLLLGVTLLSLIYAFLVRWRQSVWAAVVAHTFFDAVQLLVIVPQALKWVPGAGRALAGLLG